MSANNFQTGSCGDGVVLVNPESNHAFALFPDKWVENSDVYPSLQRAKLLAAAPGLFEALQGTMEALGRMIEKHDPDSIEAEWIGNANEAILKATK
jgi:hypothetical protein